MRIDDARALLDTSLLTWLDGIAYGSALPANVLSTPDTRFDVIDPGTGRALINLASASSDDVNRAIELGRRAFSDGRWSRCDPERRQDVLLQLANLVERDFATLTTIEALDTGKPLAEAELDIREVVSVLRYYAGWATKVTGSTIASVEQFDARTIRGPVGVCAAITPWNYPLPILMYKLAPALAFGNSFIGKPSELAPLSAIYFAGLCLEAGLPDDVVWILPGAGEVGAALASHRGIDKIAFTGSSRTGQSVMRSAADGLTKVTLELGGKSPHIVFASADLEAAVEGVALGIWTNSGQVCVAGSRLLIEESVEGKFLDLLDQRIGDMVLGHALDPDSQMGPLISARQRDKVAASIQQATADGARLIVGGEIPEGDGYFLQPTVVTGLNSQHEVYQQELFGPVLVVETFNDESDAILKGNSTPYGLAAGVWTGRAGQGTRVARGLSAGTVWLNTYGIFHPTLPFGGTRDSGFGRELGESAVDAYTETKTILEDIGG